MTDTLEPRVWIGCLACYNGGRLVGQWYDAEDAGEVTVEQVHTHGKGLPEPWSQHLGPWLAAADWLHHEELWCFDHEGWGGLLTGEVSPLEASKVWEALEQVDEDQRPAFAAWVSHVGASVEDASDFEDHYHGEWDSWMDYVDNFVEDTGMLHGVDETAVRYFNRDAYGRDMKFDMTVIDKPDGGVWVFTS